MNNFPDEKRIREIVREELQKLPVFPGPTTPKLAKSLGCPVCGIGSRGETLGYVCTRSDCPTRVTC